MPTDKKKRLDNSDLVASLNEQLCKFSDTYYPLHSKQLTAIQRATDLVQSDSSSIGDNTSKKRARTTLLDLWNHVPEAFFLCALAYPPSVLGTLASTDYMKPVMQWWVQQADVLPRGFTQALDRHSDALPTVPRDQRQASLKISFGALLAYLQQRYGHQEVEISLPFSGTPLPSVRLEGHAKIELSLELANSFTHEYQKLRS